MFARFTLFEQWRERERERTSLASSFSSACERSLSAVMDSIRVGIRVRPLIDREKGGVQWVIQGENAIVPTAPGHAGFEFDHVFGETSTTDQIYSTITKPIVHSVMQGFNGTVFAYGQTSSGKTFTMMGTEEQPGVIPLAIQEIFEYIEEHEELEFIVRVSYLEIYKEGICDLLDPSFTDLKIREDKDNNVKVHGLKEYVVTNIEEVTRVIFVGNINRTTGETKMNERSSRSHAVLSLAIESRLKDGDSTVKVASLNLVDLAGSERLNATGAAGKRAQEGIAINKSLFTLKQVISKLSEGNASAHIPYRDSKLTHILKPSLGGNAKTAIICAVTPAEVYETELTLNFAICAMKVKNRPMVNEVLGGEEALRKKLTQLEKENGQLRNKLGSSEICLTEEMRRELTEQIEEKESTQSELEARIRSLENIIIKSCKPQQRQEAGKQQGGKYNRRMTICPASLARGMGSPLLIKPQPVSRIKSRHSTTPVVTPDIPTHRSVSRLRGGGVGFATPGSAEDWQPFFDSSGFEKELQSIASSNTGRGGGGGRSNVAEEGGAPPQPYVSVQDLEERRLTMFRRATFVMDTPSVNLSSVSTPDQSGTWTANEEAAPTEPRPPRPPTVTARSMADATTQTDQEGEEEGESANTVEPMDTVEVITHADAIIQTEEEEKDVTIDVTIEAVPLIDAVTQTGEEAPEDTPVEVATQTDEAAPRCGDESSSEVPPPPLPTPVSVVDLNTSTCMCNHHCSLRKNLNEQLQFNQDELMCLQEEAEQNLIDAQYTIDQTQLELQAERERCQSLTNQLEKTNTRLKHLEMASSAQEEYLTKMCRQSKMSSSHEERCSQLEGQLREVEREREEERGKWRGEEEGWREERERWEREKEAWAREKEIWRSEKEVLMEKKDKMEREWFMEEKDKMEREWFMEEKDKMERERDGLMEEKDKWERERDEKDKIEMELEREGLLEEKDKWERERDEIDKMEMEIKWLLEEKDKWERERDEKDMIEMEMEREGLLEEKDKWERERDEIDKMEMEIKWLLEKKDKWERERDEKDKMERERDGLMGEKDKWERERDGLMEEKDKMEREGWLAEKGEWEEERCNWLEGWRKEKEEWGKERETWAREKRDWETAKETWEEERGEMVMEASVLKGQLESLQSELEKLPSSKRHCPEPVDDAQITFLMDKLQEMEKEREREAEQFQISYQQKDRELQKARETVYLLQVQLEEEATPTVAQTTPTVATHPLSEDLMRAEEELGRREIELKEKDAAIVNLQSQLSSMAETVARAHTLETELSSSSQQLATSAVLAQTKSSELERAEVALAGMESELQSTRHQLRDTLTALEVKSEEYTGVCGEVAELRSEMENVRGEVETLYRERGKWEGERERLQRAHDEERGKWEGEREGLRMAQEEKEKWEGEREGLRMAQEEEKEKWEGEREGLRMAQEEEKERWEGEREGLRMAQEEEKERWEGEREGLRMAREEERGKWEGEKERLRMAQEEEKERWEGEGEGLRMAREEVESHVEAVSSQLREMEQQLLQQRIATADEMQKLLKEREAQWQQEMQTGTEEAKRALEGKEETWQREMLAMEENQQLMRAVAQNLREELAERERDWHQELISIRQKAEGEVAEKEAMFHEQLTEALLKAQSDTADKLDALEEELNNETQEAKAACERAERKVTELQAALDSAQEGVAKSASLEEEVKQLRGQVDTLYRNIADLAQDNYRQMADKEEQWAEERERLLMKVKVQEDEVAQLSSQTSDLQAKLKQAQQKQPGPVERAETAAKLRDLQKDNASLKAQVKAYKTYQPSQTSAGAICCDSAGPVTSAAVYHLRGELTKAREEKERLEGRIKKLRAAVEERDELHDLDQKEIERYQNERNIFRAKYLDLKERCAKFLPSLPESRVSNPTPTITGKLLIHVPPPTSQQPPSSSVGQPTSFPSSSQPPTSSQAPTSSKVPTSTHLFSQPPTSSSQAPTSTHLFSQPPSTYTSSTTGVFNPSSTGVFNPSSSSAVSSQTTVPARSIFSAYLPQKPKTQPLTTKPLGQPPTTKPTVGQLGKVVGMAESTKQRENFPLGVGGGASLLGNKPSFKVGKETIGNQVGERSSGNRVTEESVGTKGGSRNSQQPRPAVLLSPNMEDRLWNTSVIQTGPLPPPSSQAPTSSYADLNKCHQQ